MSGVTMTFREWVGILHERGRWSHLCKSALGSPIGNTEHDVIEGVFSPALKHYILNEVSNQPLFERRILVDEVESVIRSRAFVLRALRRPSSSAFVLRDLLWPRDEQNRTRFDVCFSDEKANLGSTLLGLLRLLPRTPISDVLDSPRRIPEIAYHPKCDQIDWARQAVLYERFTEPIRSNWGEILAFVDWYEPRQVEQTLAVCELRVVFAIVQRVAVLPRAIEIARHAPVPVAIVALTMLRPRHLHPSQASRAIEKAYNAFNSGHAEADACLKLAVAENSELLNEEQAIWRKVEAALASRRDIAAALAVVGSSTDHPIAYASIKQALVRCTDEEICSAVAGFQSSGVDSSRELLLLRSVAGENSSVNSLAKIHDIGKGLGAVEGALVLFDPVHAGLSGLEMFLSGVVSESIENVSAAMRLLSVNVDATIQLLRGRYIEGLRDAKNGSLARILAMLEGLVWVHQQGRAAECAAPNLVEGTTGLLEEAEKFFEWFYPLDVSEYLMPKFFEYAAQTGDQHLLVRLGGTLRRAFSFSETLQQWPAWLPRGGEARSTLLAAFHRDVLHDHSAYFVGTHRFSPDRTPDALRPFLEVDCDDCERRVLERLAAVSWQGSVLRSLCSAALSNATADAVKWATTLGSYPLMHESWRHFRNAVILAAQRLVPEIEGTIPRTAWARRFEEGIWDRTSLLANELTF
jgi:hypothetical protein